MKNNILFQKAQTARYLALEQTSITSKTETEQNE